MPLVSVIIPAYNSGPRIQETLKSVLDQDTDDFELIVVDDGSTDDTTKYVLGIDPRIKLIRQPNIGIAGARNTGIGHASGDFIAFLDHDDIWHPSKLSAQLACFEEHPQVGCIYTGFRRWDEDAPAIFEDKTLDPTDLNPEFSGWVYHVLIMDNQLLGTALFRREIVETVGEFDGSLPPSDDWDFAIRASRVCQFEKLRQVTTLYRIHEKQTSRQLSSVNVSAEFRNRTIQRYGMKGPDGKGINRSVLNEYSFKSHVTFGADHLQDGDPRVAAASMLRAIRCRPWAFEAYAYLLLCGWKVAQRRWRNS